MTYRGTVIDDLGEPLPGANIVVKNIEGAVGTTTDVNGDFSIVLDEGTWIFSISYVGMKTQEVRIIDAKKLTVRLKSDSEILEETVVTGIYTRKAESFTGSMSTFKQEELKAVGNQNVLQSLKLLDPSFIVLENNLTGSDPNATMNLNMRGA
ncbi:MAG: carboxypeptidase-like regulatory domain-containing protein, partial [Lachnospiraceae bacterium]|nr:carboxypeptidase-like regulatory domain-containing protein [Lachnospiraceae bacterium]